MYPDETELQRALKEKDITKLGDLVVILSYLFYFKNYKDRGRSKLDELHRKWQEKKEMEQMKESGLLNSSTQQISSLIQEPRFGGRSSGIGIMWTNY